MASRTIRVDYLARVEGEAALDLRIRDGRVTSAHLSIFEPPRLFEALLRGRRHDEAPDIASRICGICPVAYQMSAVQAMESAFGLRVDGQLRALRRLLYCGEWIESHALHIVMLHAPDFLGFEDGIAMAAEHGDAVRAGLRLKKIGNALMTLLGGREIHPVGLRVGGWHRVPTKQELQSIATDLVEARELAVQTLRWVAGFRFPDYERDYEFVALRHPSEYPITEGRIVSSRGLDIDVAAYDSEFEERHVSHSTALQSVLKRRGAYLVGPLARYNLNFDRLSPAVQELATSVGMAATERNPFRSILVRAIELVQICEDAHRIIAEYERPAAPALAVTPRAAIGHACTEAPRGILYHRYELDAAGDIVTARIVPPTSQNQLSVEEDLRDIATASLHLPEHELRDICEQTIRNYDPCISCACHFLKLRLDQA